MCMLAKKLIILSDVYEITPGTLSSACVQEKIIVASAVNDIRSCKIPHRNDILMFDDFLV